MENFSHDPDRSMDSADFEQYEKFNEPSMSMTGRSGAEDEEGKKEKKVDDMVVTDEDLISFRFLDDAIRVKESKKRGKQNIIDDFIKNAIEKKTLEAVRRLGGGTDAQKKKVRSSFIPDQLNKVLESLHTEIYKFGFKLKLLHGKFAAKSRKPIRDARKFKKTFL
jgi:hypothetical protein